MHLNYWEEKAINYKWAPTLHFNYWGTTSCTITIVIEQPQVCLITIEQPQVWIIKTHCYYLISRINFIFVKGMWKKKGYNM